VRTRAPVKAPDRGRGDVIQDMLGILSGLNKSRRADFFTTLWDKFRDELIAAQSVSAKKALPGDRDALYADGLDKVSARGVIEQIVGNAADPETSAETMKAKIAAVDDGIPESLRRTA
jgi:hypothetical protein